MDKRLQDILVFILINGPVGISVISDYLNNEFSIPTLNRDLAKLKKLAYIASEGKGPQTKYVVELKNLYLLPIDENLFFNLDIDHRQVKKNFNLDLIDNLQKINLFTEFEQKTLEELSSQFKRRKLNKKSISYKKEFERLMIELSWKSSQIEGNTYDLLDTEQLLKFGIKSKKYTDEEAKMLLNHKAAIEFTFDNASEFKKISINKIIDIHTLLTRGMGISKKIRNRIVRITGTQYTPLSNDFLIMEALENTCELINRKKNIFEKALLALLLISYIQPFEDGNKRTARLTANAILMSANLCPLSYRSVDNIEYKKGMLLFYEINNLTAFKKIFIEQYVFGVNNYF